MTASGIARRSKLAAKALAQEPPGEIAAELRDVLAQSLAITARRDVNGVAADSDGLGVADKRATPEADG